MAGFFPRTFQIRNLKTGGVTIHLRAGGQRPAVIMLHGFGFTGDMWDLRGMRLSSHPEGGYDKKTISRPSWDKPKIQKAAFVTNDIGNMVGCAFAAQFPARGHFNFRGPDVERLVKGRERIYLDRFWNELSANPKAIKEATRRHYARLYALPGAMHSALNQFAAFLQDASENKWPMASLQCAYWRSAAIIRSARKWPTSCAW